MRRSCLESANCVREALEALVAEATGLPPTAIHVSLRPPLPYQSNRLYDAWAGSRHLIVKEFLKVDEFQDAPRREYGALKLLAPLDIAPKPVLYEPSPSPPLGPTVIYEFLEGDMWSRRPPSAAELAQLATVWLEFNALPTEGLWMSRGYERPLQEREAQFRSAFDDYAAWAGDEYRPARRVAERCLGLLEGCRAGARELEDRAPSLCFCQTDTRFANVIRRPDGRLGLVDWEDSGLRDPARDLAGLLTHPNQEDLLSPAEWQAFLEPYLAVRGRFDPQLVRRTHLYLALFPVFWLAILVGEGLRRASNGRLAGWEVNGLPANERLRRYFARALAWPKADFSDQVQALAEVVFFPDG